MARGAIGGTLFGRWARFALLVAGLTAVVALAGCTAPTTGSPASWEFNTVDGQGGSVGDHSLVTYAGQPQIFYGSPCCTGTNSNPSVSHAWLDGTGYVSWRYERPMPFGDLEGYKPSAITFRNQIHLFSTNVEYTHLYHRIYDPVAGWLPVQDLLSPYVPMGLTAIVEYGQLHVFYNGEGGLTHEYSADGTHFTSEIIGLLNQPRTMGPSGITAVSYAGGLHLFYSDRGGTSPSSLLSHIWYDGRTWHHEVLDGRGSSTDPAPTASVFDGGIHVFYSQGNGGIRHAWYDGTNWHFEGFDGVGSTLPGHAARTSGAESSLVWQGQLNLFYGVERNAGGVGQATLRHAYYGPGTGWHFEDFDSQRLDGELSTNIVNDQPWVVFGNSQGIQYGAYR